MRGRASHPCPVGTGNESTHAGLLSPILLMRAVEPRHHRGSALSETPAPRPPCVWDDMEFFIKASIQPRDKPFIKPWVEAYMKAMRWFRPLLQLCLRLIVG